MPAYSSLPAPMAPLPEVALPGKPAYFYGSLPTTTADCQIRVATVAITSNVATVTGTIVAGNTPAVGNLISIQGTTNTSGLFNVTAIALTGVTLTSATAGTVSVTFALTHANIATAADSGLAVVPIAETSETVANGSSVAIYVPSQEANDLGEKWVTTAVSFPTMPTAAVVILQSAINNIDAEFTQVGSVNAATVTGSAQTVGPVQTFNVAGGRFFRLNVSGVSGSGKMIAKMIP